MLYYMYTKLLVKGIVMEISTLKQLNEYIDQGYRLSRKIFKEEIISVSWERVAKMTKKGEGEEGRDHNSFFSTG